MDKQDKLNSLSLGLENGAWIEAQEELYLKDPALLDPAWRQFFETLPTQKAISAPTASPTVPPTVPTASLHTEEALLDVKVKELIDAYRTYGHLAAHVNPMEESSPICFEQQPLKVLQYTTYGMTSKDLETNVPAHGFFETPKIPLKQLIEKLHNLYCVHIGFEYMHLGHPEVERFIQQHVEQTHSGSLAAKTRSIEAKQEILQHLSRSEAFERFLHQNYTGQKRFSLEGGETLIPMLHELIDEASAIGYQEFVFGMAHRGRLNVLANVLEKSYEEIFSEFEEHSPKKSREGSGDVKYHKGFALTRKARSGATVALTLSANPSHLESVYPVVEGMARARCVHLGDTKHVLPIVLHGDGALAGQGVVYETLQMAHLEGYETGGTLHMVINNQIGFTTPPKQARCTRYCTDIARGFGIPVFHVNAEDPEKCLFVTQLALLLRHHFGTDVFIDLNCYRKYGHNEGDEPAFTQPLQAAWIKARPSIYALYKNRLHTEGLDLGAAEALEKKCAADLEASFARRSEAKATPGPSQLPAVQDDIAKVPQAQLLDLTEHCCQIPSGLRLHPKIEQVYKTRLEMAQGKHPCDWGMAEMLAFAAMVTEGTAVRLSGQDSARGTFSHRHAVWVDQQTQGTYYPLAHLSDTQARFDVYNSLLSEYAALGFEFGYSVADQESCVLWEAQFGDFANGAQIIIDQYIAAASQKWDLSFDLILLLPHGYEGQGPEHSSARLERFLALCGNDNMFVTYPTTPAQFFHLLRRQQKAHVHRPLIVMTPKGLLRHPECTSSIQEIAEGCFQEILVEEITKKTATLVLCTGRIFYDIAGERAKRGTEDMALVRVEQLYPLPEAFLALLKTHKNIKRLVWAQEEPENMGAFRYMLAKLADVCPLEYVGRPASASPAVGAHARHRLEHELLMDALFNASFR